MYKRQIPFRWSALANFNRPYFLAGGLTPETIPEAFAQLHPWGIDMSSGLETDGLKDDAKIAAAILAIKDSQQLPSTKGAVSYTHLASPWQRKTGTRTHVAAT